MSLYIPKMSDTPGVTIPGLADNFNLLKGSQIVEHGSNENGQYWRWENGLQICARTANINYVSSSRYGQNLNMPANFSDSLYFVVATMRELSGYAAPLGLFVLPNGPNNIGLNIYGTGFSESIKPTVQIVAIGRWK